MIDNLTSIIGYVTFAGICASLENCPVLEVVSKQSEVTQVPEFFRRNVCRSVYHMHGKFMTYGIIYLVAIVSHAFFHSYYRVLGVSFRQL